ncbi:hypothetical protein [Jeongeupia chitinilytica]|uniref:MipA/OmpV family protein n=1 Tax=Jeongeupia chitinilytica TaxID=1041641 RepID=A0ABQ3GZB7_9NEIS|nr:hypothetical protein [Jeongeupia chitinilytica]GHD62548.1 hypothetical protein GCM10007350_18740 [Jeongeupia chitinilytica]
MKSLTRTALVALLLAGIPLPVFADNAPPFFDFSVSTPAPDVDPSPSWVWLAGKAASSLVPKYDPARLTFFGDPTLVVGFSGMRRARYIGNELREDNPQSLLFPFANYTFENGITLGLQAETSYSSYSGDWDTPVNLTLSRRFDFGKQALTVGGGLQQFSSETPRWGLGVMWQLPWAQ